MIAANSRSSFVLPTHMHAGDSLNGNESDRTTVELHDTALTFDDPHCVQRHPPNFMAEPIQMITQSPNVIRVKSK